ncbi:MAG: mannitol dehydrogenase family protein [Frankiales bacterium]|nr:mannitol dehydrogenase family protein [Frankiales bacterium]
MHLGLGGFFRSHQAWFTQAASDRDAWGIAAFSGRSRRLAESLARQDCLYVLDVRAQSGSSYEVVESLVAAHPGDDLAAWSAYWADPAVRYVTLTVTEAGYHLGAEGALDESDPDVAADLGDLRSARAGDQPPLRTPVGRLVSGMRARRSADAGPIVVIPCDNLPDNGVALAASVRRLAERVDPALADWVAHSATFVSTVVDRITPATTDADRARIAAGSGYDDAVPVVTEPFAEWVLESAPGGELPRWDTAGARWVPDTRPYGTRKLALLNGAHSLLAYAAPWRGHRTVAEAIADDVCRAWVEQWWDEACAHLTLPDAELAAYRAALAERFANAAIEHRLAQIAQDGSLKLPVRILPTLRAERAASRLPLGAARVLAAWVLALRSPDGPAPDPRAAELVALAAGPLRQGVARALGVLDPSLAADAELVAAVVALGEELAR